MHPIKSSSMTELEEIECLNKITREISFAIDNCRGMIRDALVESPNDIYIPFGDFLRNVEIDTNCVTAYYRHHNYEFPNHKIRCSIGNITSHVPVARLQDMVEFSKVLSDLKDDGYEVYAVRIYKFYANLCGIIIKRKGN